MPDISLDRGRFGQLVADLDYPQIMLGAFRIRGRDGWVDAIPRTVRSERLHLLTLLRRPLVLATTGARARFRQWRDRRAPLPPLPQTERRAWIHERIELHGDES